MHCDSDYAKTPSDCGAGVDASACDRATHCGIDYACERCACDAAYEPASDYSYENDCSSHRAAEPLEIASDGDHFRSFHCDAFEPETGCTTVNVPDPDHYLWVQLEPRKHRVVSRQCACGHHLASRRCESAPADVMRLEELCCAAFRAPHDARVDGF